MFAEKNRTTNTVADGINTKEMEFKPLKDFIGKSVQIFGYFFTNGKYGKQVVAVTKEVLINLPKRYTEEFEAFTGEEIDAVKNGKLMLADIREIDSNNGKTVAFDYADVM